MSVVIAQDPPAIGLVQGQRITDAVRDVCCNRHPPRFNLDPVAIALVNDLVMKFDKGGDARVFAHAQVYQRLIKIRPWRG